MIDMPELSEVFEAPKLIFTLSGNPKSQLVIDELLKISCPARTRVFKTQAEIKKHFESNGNSPASSLVLFDDNIGNSHFHPTCRNRRREVKSPDWAMGTQWIVIVGKRCKPDGCARQINADFCRKFEDQLVQGQFPWGQGKIFAGQREEPPKPVSLPETILQTIQSLNQGPDLAQAIADTAHAAELPPGSKISWIRIVPEPLHFNTQMLEQVLSAMQEFEEACNKLVHKNCAVQKQLLAGVHLPQNFMLSCAYLFPRVSKFSVGRPDLHYTDQNSLPFASEIDEMPGGMPDLVHIDNVYGTNQQRWKNAFDWLCEEGLLVFLVSNEWSKCYIPETEWLVTHLQNLGYPVNILTTDRANEIEFRDHSLWLNNKKIGTIWRQFPIFETKGKLANIVLAAYKGWVRMVPEFAHFGNKAWFSVFRSHNSFYKNSLEAKTFEILDKVLPHSYIVNRESNPFPVTINGVAINSIANLRELSQEGRDHLVLKICGANNMAARSYGVLMGVGIDSKDWKDWIDQRMALGQPFVIQRRLEAGIAKIPVRNTSTGLDELFSCRILARPWSFNGQLVSVHGCAVPSYLYRVHGMVDMAVVPFAL